MVKWLFGGEYVASEDERNHATPAWRAWRLKMWRAANEAGLLEGVTLPITDEELLQLLVRDARAKAAARTPEEIAALRAAQEQEPPDPNAKALHTQTQRRYLDMI